MSDFYRQQLWEALYTNPVYPAELLENLRDPEYTNVSYIRIDAGCVVDLSFYDEGQLITAKYFFDAQDQLQKAIMYEGRKESIIYDRQAIVDATLVKIALSNSREQRSVQSA